MIEVKPYNDDDRDLWDAFVAASKNGSLLFYRAFMEYHADRFVDASLMFFQDSSLVAVLPANLSGSEVLSHGGLTFGGIVSSSRMTTDTMLEVVSALLTTLRTWGVRRFIYKAIPSFFHELPSDEDLFAIHHFGGRLFRRDVTTILRPSAGLKFAKGRRYSIKRALKAGLTVSESSDFESFWRVLEATLEERHGAKPTHSLEEIVLLHSRFPESIRLYAAYGDSEMLAGSVVFESSNVAHTQYLASSEAGRGLGALDLVIGHLIRDRFLDKPWFSFGISTESGGTILNSGLIQYKEGFGGRAGVHDFYEILL